MTLVRPNLVSCALLSYISYFKFIICRPSFFSNVSIFIAEFLDFKTESQTLDCNNFTKLMLLCEEFPQRIDELLFTSIHMYIVWCFPKYRCKMSGNREEFQRLMWKTKKVNDFSPVCRWNKSVICFAYILDLLPRSLPARGEPKC